MDRTNGTTFDRNGNQIVCIPVKSYSRRLENKNMRLLNEVPLFFYTLMQVAKYLSGVSFFVSTDNEYIQRVAIEFGAVNVALRPPHLCLDAVTNHDVIDYHIAAGHIESNCYLTLLQVTSPFRIGHIFERLKTCASDRLAVVGVDGPIQKKQGILRGANSTEFVENQIFPRGVYLTNASIYGGVVVNGRQNIMSEPNPCLIGMSKPYNLDINDYFDWVSAETYIEKNLLPADLMEFVSLVNYAWKENYA